MRSGRVVEQGRYEDLAQGNRLFAELLALSNDR